MSDAEPLEEPETTYTITELADASGVPERTIRFYRKSGLIEPPRRDGRRAHYSEEQLPRVRLIAELREAGLSLDAIKEMLTHPSGNTRGLAHVLRISEELRAPWMDDAATRMSEAAVIRTYGVDDPDALALLESNGIIVRNPGRHSVTFTVPSVRTLQLSGQVTASGVPADIVLVALRLIQDHLADMSHELIEMFTDWAGQTATTKKIDRNIELNFEQLQRLGLDAVQLFFAKAIENELDAFVERGGLLELNSRRPVAEVAPLPPS